MQLVAYLYGIASERQLCEDVYYNLAYRWFCRLPLTEDVPDHSSIKLAERMWKIEGLFAETKRNHCLSRAKYRGRSKVQIQAYLCAMAQNLKRLLFPLYPCLVAWWLGKRLWPSSLTSAPDPKSDFFNRPGRSSRS
jgi:IS5 family transposase